MAQKPPKTYRSRHPVRIALVTLLCVVLASVIFCVSVFFGFRKYIVYTPDGELRVEVPWLEGADTPISSPDTQE